MTSTVRYETEVVQIGAMVAELHAAGMIILFGEIAPQELHDLAVLHRPSSALEAPQPGDVLEIDGARLRVTAVGSVVPENLLRLGHLTLKADGAREAALPGDLNVEPVTLPLPHPGTVIRFIAPDPGSTPGDLAVDHSKELA